MFFFLTYTLVMFFILVNVFLAILNDAYGSVKGEIEEEKERQHIEREERPPSSGSNPSGWPSGWPPVATCCQLLALARRCWLPCTAVDAPLPRAASWQERIAAGLEERTSFGQRFSVAQVTVARIPTRVQAGVVVGGGC